MKMANYISPIIASVVTYSISIITFNLLHVIDYVDSVVLSYFISMLSSLPIFKFIWMQLKNPIGKLMLVTYWPAIIIIYIITPEIYSKSGDGEVFVRLTERFVQSVFEEGSFFPEKGFFVSQSINYWFTIYFYGIPYFIYNSTYDAILPFLFFISVCVSQLFYSLAYYQTKNIRISSLSFLFMLYFPGYWLHNFGVERDIVILLQLILFLYLLKTIITKKWFFKSLLMLVLFFTMLGSRGEYIIVFFAFIIGNFFERIQITTQKIFNYYILLVCLVFISLSYGMSQLDVVNPERYSSILSLITTILNFPLYIFYSSVGAFPWTREGIIMDVGGSYIYLFMHIISTVIRIIILVCIVSVIFIKLKIFNSISNKLPLHYYYGFSLLISAQFGLIGYTRYVDPAIVLIYLSFIYYLTTNYKMYFLWTILIIAIAHYLYYFL